MFIHLLGDLAPLWLEEVSKAMTRRSNLETETARQMFLVVREVTQRFATRGTVAEQSLVQRFFLKEEPPRSRNPGLDACFQALRAEPDFGARAIAHYVRAEHEPQLPNLYAVSATIDRVVDLVIRRLADSEEEPEVAEGTEAVAVQEKGAVAVGTGEMGTAEARETGQAGQAASGGRSAGAHVYLLPPGQPPSS